MTSQFIEVAVGKSATIVSPSQLAINVGALAGVQVGDLAKVRKTVVVIDPDSKVELGKVHLTRLNLRITTAYESFSIGTVTDFVATTPNTKVIAIGLESTRVRRRKTIVSSEYQASDSAVHVSAGESVVVTRAVELGDDAGSDE